MVADLRRDPRPQVSDQQQVLQARNDWLAAPAIAAIAEEMRRFASERVLASRDALIGNYPRLGALFSNPSEARSFSRQWCAPMIRAMRSAPLGHAAYRHQHNHNYTNLHLMNVGSASLSLVLVTAPAAGTLPKQDTLAFSDNERHEIVLSGAADLRIVNRSSASDEKAVLEFRPVRSTHGSRLSLTGERQALIVDAVDSYYLRLRLVRTPARPDPTREYRLSDGALVHQSAGQSGDSRRELALAVLGAMNDTDSVPAMTALALGDAPAHLRWQAVRHAIALDTRRGFETLCSLANSDCDELAEPAAALRDSLVHTYPVLEELSCPA